MMKPKSFRGTVKALGAAYIADVPETGGGRFGAALLARNLHERLMPASGEPPGGTAVPCLGPNAQSQESRSG